MSHFMQLLYYSFYVGVLGTDRKSWGFQDDKVPAYSPREALIIHRVIKNNCKEYSFKPNYNYYRSIYRYMIEYERKPGKGKTRMDFVKVREFTEYQIMAILKRDFEKEF
ncbi:MAG: hypothetical protein HOP11_02490 [Saprospiraceae bacterium]|nr:hypothetical protein [Saprospiraceae bacterium]